MNFLKPQEHTLSSLTVHRFRSVICFRFFYQFFQIIVQKLRLLGYLIFAKFDMFTFEMKETRNSKNRK